MSKSKVRPPEVLEPAEAVLRFLGSVGPNSEAEFYLRLFRSRAPESFAALAVTAAAVEHHADGVALDLRFLNALGLTPVVVVGLHDPDNAAEHVQTLDEHLVRAGLRTRRLTTDALPEAIASACADATIPLLVAEGSGPGARLEALGGMLAALATHKLIFLDPRGGLELAGEPLSVLSLTKQEPPNGNLVLDLAEKRLLEDSRRLIFELVPHRLLITLTSPLNLLHELFTVKGAGTLLRKGASIARHEGYSGVDLPRLEALLGSSFGKQLAPGLFQRPLKYAYIEESYRGAALVAQTELGAYLSKFAVTREAQGEGIGQDLWNAVTADHKALFWRARAANPVRAWYERQCQGRFDSAGWTVYFRGIPPEKIADAIAYALTQPVDF